MSGPNREGLQPLRLTRVTIENFRGIDKLEIDLPPDDGDRAGALVLAGDNGVGKTSVLEAILILFGRLDLLPSDTAGPEELVRQGATDTIIRGTLHLGERKAQWNVNAGQLIRGYIRAGSETSFPFGIPVAKTSLDVLIPPDSGPGTRPSTFNIEYFSARREPEDLGAGLTESHGRTVTRQERRLSELKRRLVNVFSKRGSHNTTFERIQTFMRVFMGDRWTLDVVFRSAQEGSDPVVVVRDGELPPEELTLDAIRERASRGEPLPRVIPIDQLSAGQVALLAMTYPFVFGDRAPDIVLIDEPEQHLHPTWQRAFLGALRTLSPTTQFVVATHSPWVLDSVPTYERRELVAHDDSRVGLHTDAAE